MGLSTKKVIVSFSVFALLAFAVFLLGKQQKDGVISTAWAFFYLEWVVFGCIGLILFVLRKTNLFKGKTSFFYIFLGVVNLCNAGCGMALLWSGSGQEDMASTWLQLGATGCIAFLMLIDALY